MTAYVWIPVLLTAGPAAEGPVSRDPRLAVRLFAEAPDVATPTGIAVDAAGRVFVVESHTHFRPKDYPGPPKDRIRILEDSDGDGRADRFSTFFEGSEATMSLAFGPGGNLYAATRREIFVLEGVEGRGEPDRVRSIVHLRTRGDYPHNGLAGFAFGPAGEVYFGLGENLGAAYSLVGSDGTVLTGGGEGGSVYVCRPDGGGLRRVATGFWNPFALCLDAAGELFVVDNDPDSRPPCRLLHVVPGGDYGFQFRFGRNGLHPFQAWNGELPGTLPMVAGTGEAPSGIVSYERGEFPPEYFHSLLVASWGDHRIERYEPRAVGRSFRATMAPVIVGGEDFRPVGLALAPDGSLFVSDWVDKSYELHGKGRVWRIASTEPPGRRRVPEGRRLSPASDLAGSPENAPALLAALDSGDPFERCAARRGLREAFPVDVLVEMFHKESGPRRGEILLALRDLAGDPPPGVLAAALRDADPATGLVAVQWIGTARRLEHRAELERMLAEETSWTRPLLESTLAAMELLDKGYATPDAGAGFAVRVLDREGAPPSLAASLLRIVPPDHEWLTAERYRSLCASADERLAIEGVRSLRESRLVERGSLLESIALDAGRPEAVRAEAALGLPDGSPALAALGSSESPQLRRIGNRSASPRDAAPTPPESLRRRVEALAAGAPGDAAAGERLFFDPKGPGCYRCHQLAGRGGRAGPDLTAVARGNDRGRLIDALVDPSRDVAPMFVAWTIVAADGRVRNGVLVREGLKGEQFYVGPDGVEFEIQPAEIEDRAPSKESLMPAGLLASCSDEEIRDLLAFLESLK